MARLQWAPGTRQVDCMYYVREAGEEPLPPIEGAPLFGIVDVHDVVSEDLDEHYYWDGSTFQLIQHGADSHSFVPNKLRFCADHSAHGRCGWVTREVFAQTTNITVVEHLQTARPQVDVEVLHYGSPDEKTSGVPLSRPSERTAAFKHGLGRVRQHREQSVEPFALASQSNRSLVDTGKWPLSSTVGPAIQQLHQESRRLEPPESSFLKPESTGQLRLVFEKLNQVLETTEVAANQKRGEQIDAFSTYLGRTYERREARHYERSCTADEEGAGSTRQEKLQRDYYDTADEALRKVIAELSQPDDLKKARQLQKERGKCTERLSVLDKQMVDWRDKMQHLRREIAMTRTMTRTGERRDMNDEVDTDTDFQSLMEISPTESPPITGEPASARSEQHLKELEARFQAIEQNYRRTTNSKAEAASQRVRDQERMRRRDYATVALTQKLLARHATSIQQAQGSVFALGDRMNGLQSQLGELNDHVRGIRQPNHMAAVEMIEGRLKAEASQILTRATEAFQREHGKRVEGEVAAVRKPFTIMAEILESVSSGTKEL